VLVCSYVSFITAEKIETNTKIFGKMSESKASPYLFYCDMGLWKIIMLYCHSEYRTAMISEQHKYFFLEECWHIIRAMIPSQI